MQAKSFHSWATGLDRVSTRRIRFCADLIYVPVCDIFNQSFRQGKLQKTGNLVESHPFSRKVIETTETITVRSRLSQLWSRYWREKFTNCLCLFTGARYTMQTSVGFFCYSLDCYSFAWGNWLLSIWYRHWENQRGNFSRSRESFRYRWPQHSSI